MINFTPFPNIETKNLTLRRIEDSDCNDLFEMRKDPEMNQYIDTKPDTNTHETKAYIDKMNKGIDENKWIIWGIEEKQSKKVIGTICIWNINREQQRGEVGYGMIPVKQGKGFMQESLISVVKYGFDAMNLREIVAYTEEKNLKSIKLLERNNFIEINRIEEKGYYNPIVNRMVVYRLMKNKG